MAIVQQLPVPPRIGRGAGAFAEVAAALTGLLRLPRVLRLGACQFVRHGSGGSSGGRAPVLMLHGYAGTEAVWAPLRGQLTEAGFDHLVSLSYNSFASDVPELAEALVSQARVAMEATGHDGVHLVGHSLGGLVARYAVQQLGLSRYARTVVTIATPHRGTSLARLGPGATARGMRPGSPLLADLRRARSSGTARWVAYYSDTDRVVPVDSAALTHPLLDVTNVLVPGRGHMSIASDPAVVASVVDQLLVAEDGPGMPAPVDVAPGPLAWWAADRAA